MTISEFIARLDTHGAKPRRTGNGWQCRCPSHDDHSASLSVREGKGGRILLKCFAGCQVQSIVGALGLTMSDLFPARQDSGRVKRRMVETYDYVEECGTLIFQSVRFEPKDFSQRRPDPQKRGKWIWNLNNTRRVLYRLPDVRAALRDGRTIFIAEGEKDVNALVKHGLDATCNPLGAKPDGSTWLPEHTETLRGAVSVVVIADKDSTGRSHARAVATALRNAAKSVKLIELPDVNGRPVKDAHDFLNAGGTADDLRKIVQTASDFAPPPEPQPCKPDPSAKERLSTENFPNGSPYARYIGKDGPDCPTRMTQKLRPKSSANSVGSAQLPKLVAPLAGQRAPPSTPTRESGNAFAIKPTKLTEPTSGGSVSDTPLSKGARQTPRRHASRTIRQSSLYDSRTIE